MSVESRGPAGGGERVAPPGRSRPRMDRDARGWRRKWRRAPAERRRAAAGSLADLFRPPPMRGGLPLLLLVSLLAHAATMPFLDFGSAASLEQVAAREDTYLRRVMQKERAKKISKQAKGRITMPPPPPDPEAVVENALTDSLASDVERITGGLLGVELQAELASYVKTNLKDELAAASKDIAQGRLSEDEIKRLHRELQDKAHEMTVAWRKDYLETHQLERAAMSTTQWYESDVSRTLVNNMYYELFIRRHIWAWQIFHRAMSRGNGRDAFIVADRDFGNRLGLFGEIQAGKRFHNDAPDALPVRSRAPRRRGGGFVRGQPLTAGGSAASSGPSARGGRQPVKGPTRAACHSRRTGSAPARP